MSRVNEFIASSLQLVVAVIDDEADMAAIADVADVTAIVDETDVVGRWYQMIKKL